MNYQIADLLQDPSLSSSSSSSSSPNKSKKEQKVTVVVSGSKFCIVPSLYKQIQTLQWQDCQGVPQLNANPDVFETLLQYFLFASLPNYSTTTSTTSISTTVVSKSKQQQQAIELKELAQGLNGVEPLMAHVETIIRAAKDRRNSSSFLRRTLPLSFGGGGGISKKKKQELENIANTFPIQETVYPFAVSKTNAILNVDYLPNLEASDSTDSDETSSGALSSSAAADDSTSLSTKGSIISTGFGFEQQRSNTIHLMEEEEQKRKTASKNKNNNICKRFLTSALQTSKKRFSTSRGLAASRKLTHEEWCATEYVL